MGGGQDAIVVGSGPNGLAAALVLAQAGLSVTVLEGQDEPGGGARTAALTLPGFLHDLCSAVHPLAVGSPFLARLPLADHGLEWVHPPAPLAHPLDDAPAVLLERSLGATAKGLGRADGRAWERLLGPLVRRFDELADELLQPLAHLPEHPFALLAFGLHGWRDAADLARECFAGARARALFAGLAAHSVLPLEQRPSAGFGLLLAAAGHAAGWPFPRGGAGRISAALASLLAAHGGRLRTGAPVASLAQLRGARAAVLDLTPRQVLALDEGLDLPPRYREALARYRYGPGAFKLDYALDAPIPWRDPACARGGTVHLGGTLEEIAEAEAAVLRGEHPARPFVLVAQPSLFDPARAPAGRHTAWAYCHVPHGSTRDMTGAVESQLERFAPGFAARVLARAASGPAELERRNPNLVGGDFSGGAMDLAQLLARPVARLDPYATPLPWLFLGSASTPPGGGVHGMCGFHAARSALRRLGASRGPTA